MVVPFRAAKRTWLAAARCPHRAVRTRPPSLRPIMRSTSLAVTLSLFLVLSLSGCDSASYDSLDLNPAADQRADARTQVERRAGGGSACPCFSVRDLIRPIDASAPEPYLFFDTFNWWGLDARRTELRTLTDVDGQPVEEVASVYITPGTAASPLVLMCHRQDVRTDPFGDGVEYTYTTIEPSLEEAEACRRAIYAAASGIQCQGPACGLPYEKGQLDPSYPGYNDEHGQLRLHTELSRTIESVRATLSLDQ
jgi:hypothetical protein